MTHIVLSIEIVFAATASDCMTQPGNPYEPPPVARSQPLSGKEPQSRNRFIGYTIIAAVATLASMGNVVTLFPPVPFVPGIISVLLAAATLMFFGMAVADAAVRSISFDEAKN